jgi:hypothetical protein
VKKKKQNKHRVCIVTPMASNKHPLSTPERITLHATLKILNVFHEEELFTYDNVARLL